MKKIILLFVLISLSTIANGQTWAPIGAKWTYTETFYMSTAIDTCTIRSIGDTVILAHQCKILKESAGNCSFRPNIEFMYSDSGKVFFYNASRNSFQMLYNFNAKIGDSSIVYPDGTYNDSIVSVVDSIRTIIINSHTITPILVLRRMFQTRLPQQALYFTP